MKSSRRTHVISTSITMKPFIKNAILLVSILLPTFITGQNLEVGNIYYHIIDGHAIVTSGI